MADAPQPAPAAAPARFAWDRIFRLTAELSALFSFIAFALSCVMNSLVFARWRHDFLQLATPSDVIMSGTHLLGDIAGPLLVAGVAASLALASLDGSGRLTGFLEKLPVGKRVGDFLGTMLMLVLLAPWGLGIGYAYYGFAVGEYFLPDTIDLSLGVFHLLVSALTLWGLISKGKNSRGRGRVPFDLVYAIAASSPGLLLCGGWFDTRIERLAAYGFHEQHLAVFENGADVCRGGSRLLWSGTQAELIECPRSTGQAGRRILVKRNSENLTIQPAVPDVR